MVPLELQIRTGPGASRRETLTGSPMTFGRDPQNTLVLSEPTASRRHGELRWESGRWVLVNHSGNGTWVNGRRVSGRPHPLSDRDVVSIGDQEVFRVISATPASAAAAEPAAPPDAAPDLAAQSQRSRRPMLLIAVALWWLGLLAVAGVLLTLDEPEEQGVQPAPELRDAQIEAEVRRPVQVEAPDLRQAQEELAVARELYGKLDAAPSNLYRAHEAYQRALAYSGQEMFADGLDTVRFEDLQHRLVRAVQEQYRQGYEQLRSGQHRAALETFRRLNQELYPDDRSLIYQNVEQQRRAAASGARRRR